MAELREALEALIRDHESEPGSDYARYGGDALLRGLRSLLAARVPTDAPGPGLREAARDVLLHDGSGIGRTDEWRGDFDALALADARKRLRAALAASPAPSRPEGLVDDESCARCGVLRRFHDGGHPWVAASSRPEGLEAIANAIFVAMVRPETIWWDDLTEELKEPYLRAARAVDRLSDTTSEASR